MVSKTSNRVFFWSTLLSLVVCMLLIAMLSGFEHEEKKFKTLLVTVSIVMLFQYLVGDPIKFVLLAVDAALWPPKTRKFSSLREATQHSRLDYLKLRLNSQKSQLLLTERHRNEPLNEMYKHISQDLFLYGKYYIFLFLLIVATQSSAPYYNTHILQRIFYTNRTHYMGLHEVYFLNKLYYYIEENLINAFTPNSTVQDTALTSWVHGEQTKMLGVVRLRQLRLSDTHVRLDSPTFTYQEYMPQWKLPYRRMHYTDKYWRIYEPWLPLNVQANWFEQLLLWFNHDGFITNYPELKGYTSLLARNRHNSQKVLQYLRSFNWLNNLTSATFMDFTLYNADVNIFSVCTLFVEHTPFGLLSTHANIESVKLLQNLDQLSHAGLLVLLLYVLVVIQFSKALVLKIWYEPKEMRNMWNKIDLVIFVLNISVLFMVLLREWLVSKLLKNVEGASKMEFIDFRIPTKLHIYVTITVGFLICITTLRLWKILQFAEVIQMFTQTLYIAWKSMASTAMVILIVLSGFSAASFVMNGNNSMNFNRIITSMVTITCFSFGFTKEIRPKDLFGGGQLIGVFMYALIGFIISILLINLFVSIINDFFTSTKIKRDAESKGRKINFLEFLKVEYADTLRYFRSFRFCRRSYRPRNRTVAENINIELMDRLTKAERVESLKYNAFAERTEKKIDDRQLYEDYRQRIHKLHSVAAIMRTQIEILELLLFDDTANEPKESEQ